MWSPNSMLVGTVKGYTAFLATRESVQRQESMPIAVLQNAQPCFLSNDSFFLGQWTNVGWGMHFLLTPSPGGQDRAPLLALGEDLHPGLNQSTYCIPPGQKLVPEVCMWVVRCVLILDMQRLCYVLLYSNLEECSPGTARRYLMITQGLRSDLLWSKLMWRKEGNQLTLTSLKSDQATCEGDFPWTLHLFIRVFTWADSSYVICHIEPK